MGDSKLGLGWGGRWEASGEQVRPLPWPMRRAQVPPCSPGGSETVLLLFSLPSSPEKVGNTLVTITDCALSGGRFFAPGELIFNNSTDDMWRSCR